MVSKLMAYFALKKQEAKRPLVASRAFTLAAAGDEMSIDDALEDFKNEILRLIKQAARMGNYELMIRIPDWMHDCQIAYLKECLVEYEYKILFDNQNVILVSWRV